MASICGDNRFEIIAKVKEHLLKATNIEMQPEELKQADNILFRLWQLGYFNQSELEKEIAELKEKLEDTEKVRDYWKSSSFDWRHKCTSRKPFKVAVKAQKQLIKAKELIKRLIKATYGEGWNYSLQVKVEAEKFLKECE